MKTNICRDYKGDIDMAQTISDFVRELQIQKSCEEDNANRYRKIIRGIFKKRYKGALIVSKALVPMIVAKMENVDSILYDFYCEEAKEYINRLVSYGVLIIKRGRMGGIGWAKDHPAPNTNMPFG